jgi:type IV pilus assembly protein PilX
MIGRQNHPAARQGGVVLVTSLLLLIVVTLLAISMFRSFGLDEKIAGNVREKQRALNAAETAEQYAEYWLTTATNTSAVTCSTLVAASVAQVCSNILSTVVTNVASVPWQISGAPVGVTYTPGLSTPMNITPMNIATSGAGNYYASPVFYISFLGTSTNGQQSFYQIDAVGYGGSPDTTAVVETTYVLQTNTLCLSCTQ